MTSIWSFLDLKEVFSKIFRRASSPADGVNLWNVFTRSPDSFFAISGEAFWTETSTDKTDPSSLTVNFEFVASCPPNRTLGRQSPSEYPSVRSLLNRSSDGRSESFLRLNVFAV